MEGRAVQLDCHLRLGIGRIEPDRPAIVQADPVLLHPPRQMRGPGQHLRDAPDLQLALAATVDEIEQLSQGRLAGMHPERRGLGAERPTVAADGRGCTR